MKVITCAGYYRTGSSALTDFFSEFDNIASIGNVEIRLLQDPYGVSNLETNIIEHPHRHNTSHAIKQFIKAAKFENGNPISKRYRRYFGNSFMKLTMEYVDSITGCKSKNHWRYDAVERGELFYMLNSLVEVMYEKTHHGRRKSLMENEYAYYSNISREDFYNATKKYTKKLLASLDNEAEYIMIDQLAAPTEAGRYLNYVEDLYVIVIDRDPRDLFILENQVKWGVIPYKNVEEFCKWYEITRAHRKNEKYDNDRVKFIRFEDFVYNYDMISDELMKFLGINIGHHVNIRGKFNPDISRKGTALFNAYPEYSNEVKYIERNLSEYLFDFENYSVNMEKPTELFL